MPEQRELIIIIYSPRALGVDSGATGWANRRGQGGYVGRTDLLLGILCILVLWNILQERGLIKSLDFAPDSTPWLLWVNTNYYGTKGTSEWEIEETFHSKHECRARMIAGLRYYDARSATLEALPGRSSLSEKKFQTKVVARTGHIMTSVWDEKKKTWEPVYSSQNQCLPNGTDPRPKIKD